MTSSTENTKSTETEIESEGSCGRGCGFWKVPFIIAAVVLLKSGLVLVLWNALVPELFHGPTLSYLQAIEVTVLAKLLVGFGFPGGGPGAHAWHGRWNKLSPEEREKLREEIRS